MTNYSTSAKLGQSGDRVIQVALSILAVNNFTIVSYDGHSAKLTSPGLNSNRQNPLLGATAIELKIEGQELKLEAEIGGPLQSFLRMLPLGVGLGVVLLLLLLGLVFGLAFKVGFGVPGAPGVTWLLICLVLGAFGAILSSVLSGTLYNEVSSSTKLALNNLVKNAVILSDSKA